MIDKTIFPTSSKMMKESGEQVDNESFKPIEAIINSMTPKERALPSILDQSMEFLACLID